MKFSELEVDQSVVEEGTWVGDLPELGDIRLKVRGANNKAWRKMAQKLVNAIPRKNRVNGVLDPEESDRVTATVILATGLLDWDGIEDDDGKPVAFDKKKAAEYLKVKRFRDGAIAACDRVAEGLIEEIEDVAGN